MTIKHFALLLLAVICLAACNKKGNDFTVIGDISNMPQQQVILEELGIAEFVLVDSVMSDEKGHFELKGTAPEEGRYRLRFTDNKYVILTIDKGNIKITADWNDIENYNVAGSPSSESFRVFMGNFRNYIKDLNTLNIVKDSMIARGNDSLLQMANAEQQDKMVSLTRYVETYADTTSSLSNALFAVQMLNPASEQDYLKAFMGGLERRFPKSAIAKEYVKKYNEMLAQQAAAAPEVTGPQIGAPAPDVTLTSTDGKQVSISSFKGKYVLVDFWASWCGPCRRENPNVVDAYNKFKDKNFTILGISLDDDRTKWMEAIKKDELTWTHISDLKGWESIAGRAYGVQSIPAIFLLDPGGKIIARDILC